MPDAAAPMKLQAVLRSLAAAARSLRLYPPASPIPLQSVQAVREALDAYFETGSDPLCISLARDGFSVDGAPVGSHIPGARDLSDELRARGVAEFDVAGKITSEELLTFLSVIARPVDEVRDGGGVAALASAGGAEHLRIAEVRLAVVEQELAAEEADALLALSEDPGDLAAWYAAASAKDPAAFEAEVESLVRSAGPDGEVRLVRSLGTTFKSQPPTGQDALLALAMKPGLTRDFVGSMFEGFDAPQIAGSILSGAFGKNMLVLSNALSNLPLEDAASEVRTEVQAMLARTGHTSDETDFLDHMLEVRARQEPESPLIDADRTYNAVLSAATLSDEDVARARDAVAASGRDISAAGVRTMLAILDDQTDFARYCQNAESLAATVPGLIEQGNLTLAAHVLAELTSRQTHNAGPWPDLCQRLEAALVVASGPRSMSALVKAVVADAALTSEARGIVQYAGDSAGPSLVAEAITQKEAGIAVAEELLGRRVIDLLNAAALDTSWHLLGPVARRLAVEGDPRSVATVEALMARPDEQSRREIVSALASLGGPTANRLLANALRDPNPDTVATAARAIARSGEPGSAALLAARLGELDIDRGDYALAKELIGALARTPGAEADEALAKLGSRRAFIKRGHFADIQSLVAEAQRARQGGIAR
jgi:hypothetical protein